MPSSHPFIRIALVAAALAGAACGTSTAPVPDGPRLVSLATRAPSYGLNDYAEIEITNHSAHYVRFQACHETVIDRLTTSGWRPVPSEVVCTDFLDGMGPNSVVIRPRDLPRSLTPGMYRIRFERMVAVPENAPEFPVPATQLITNAFEVR